MKKFYFFLVALVLGVMSASAVDYYLIGGFNGWALKDAKAKFTAKSATEYELDYQGSLTSGFKINDGTWSNDNVNFGSNGTALKLGEAYTYAVGGSTGDISLAEEAVNNPHIVLNTAAKTITITGQQTEVTISYVIWGNLPTGGSDWSATTLTENNGAWEAKNVEVKNRSEFGIRKLGNGSQIGWIAATGATTISGAGTFNCADSNTSNFAITAGTYNFSFNPTTMKLVVTTDGGDVPTPAYDVYLSGEFNNWNGADADYKFAGENGIYTLNLPTLSGNFKVVCNGQWLGTATPVVSGVSYSVSDIGMENMALAAEVGNDVKLSFNSNDYTLTVTYTTSISVTPETLYVIGDLPGDEKTHWNPTYGVELDKDGDTFSGELEIETAYANDYGFFSLCTKLTSTDTDWNVGNRYGAPTADVEVVSGETYTFQKATDPNAWKALPGLYKIYVDFGDKTIILTKLSDSVANIEMSEDAAPVYYNLQGVRVDAPANGLYIVVRGDKVAKEIVK